MKQGVQTEIEKLLEAKIIEPSCSPWVFPIVPVNKQDGSVRFCVDYLKLNSVTQLDSYYMPTLKEILEQVGQYKVLSKVDLVKGYYQVKVDEDSRNKTAFTCPFGKYQFTRMSFGLKYAPAVFQRLMDSVLRPCFSYSAPYTDDVLIFSESWTGHLDHVMSVLTELRKHGLTAKPVKCEWGMRHVEYLGHIVGDEKVLFPNTEHQLWQITSNLSARKICEH